MDTTSYDVCAADAAAVYVPVREQTVIGRLARRLVAVTGFAFGLCLLAMLFGSSSASAHTAEHQQGSSLLTGVTSSVDTDVQHVTDDTLATIAKSTSRTVRHATGKDRPGSSVPTSKSSRVTTSTQHTSSLLDDVTGVVHTTTEAAEQDISATQHLVTRLGADAVQPLTHIATSVVTQPIGKITHVAGSALETPRAIVRGVGREVIVTSRRSAERLVSARTADSTTRVHATHVGVSIATPAAYAGIRSAATSHAVRAAIAYTTRSIEPVIPAAPRPFDVNRGDQTGSTGSESGSSTSAGHQFATSAQGAPASRGTDGIRRRLPTTVGLVGVSTPRPTFSPD